MCQSEGCSFSGSVGQLVCKTIGLPVSLLKGLGRFPIDKVSLNFRFLIYSLIFKKPDQADPIVVMKS